MLLLMHCLLELVGESNCRSRGLMSNRLVLLLRLVHRLRGGHHRRWCRLGVDRRTNRQMQTRITRLVRHMVLLLREGRRLVRRMGR